MSYEIPLLYVIHTTYFGMHHVSGHDIMFLQPINVVEIHPWTFTFGNEFMGVQYGEHGYLFYPPTLPTYLQRKGGRKNQRGENPLIPPP
jgi:hypothetical protein